MVRGARGSLLTGFAHRQSAQVRYKELLGGSQEHIFGLCRKAVSMLSQAATSADHLPAIQSVFLSRLLDIRTAPSYTPRAMLPRPIDLSASMETIGLQPERTYWPPASPFFADGVNVNGGSDEQGRPMQSWTVSDPNMLAEGVNAVQHDPNDPAMQDLSLPIPEVPTSSLALSLGSFVGDTSVRDVLFANDSFWSVRAVGRWGLTLTFSSLQDVDSRDAGAALASSSCPSRRDYCCTKTRCSGHLLNTVLQ